MVKLQGLDACDGFETATVGWSTAGLDGRTGTATFFTAPGDGRTPVLLFPVVPATGEILESFRNLSLAA